jgi:hypothetical protein
VKTVTDSLAKVIGTAAKKLRTDAGVTLDLMALTARHYGLPWTSGRVGDFENGRVPATVPTLYAAVAALGQAIGRPVSLVELLPGSGRVQINDTLTVPLSAVRVALSGEPVAVVGRPAKVKLSALVGELGDADLRMIKSLGADRAAALVAMQRLWGQTFSRERDGRSGPDDNAQRRGQISRQLKAELEKALRDGND